LSFNLAHKQILKMTQLRLFVDENLGDSEPITFEGFGAERIPAVVSQIQSNQRATQAGKLDANDLGL
jgi:hypothetical protein